MCRALVSINERLGGGRGFDVEVPGPEWMSDMLAHSQEQAEYLEELRADLAHKAQG